MFNELLNTTNVTVWVAFIAGFVTFFASCLLPLVPTYLAYLSGVSLGSDQATQKRFLVIRAGGMFVLGFIATFVTMGMMLQRFMYLITPYRGLIVQIGGVLFVFFGLFVLGVFKSGFLNKEKKIDIHGKFQNHRCVQSFAAGSVFSFAWTPCVGPILALILFWAAQADSAWKGFSLLLSYGLGLGVPFLIVAALFDRLIPILRKYTWVSKYAQIFSGAFLVVAGAAMLFGQFGSFAMQITRLLHINSLSF